MKTLSKMSLVAISVLLLHLAVVPNGVAQADEGCPAECVELILYPGDINYTWVYNCRCSKKTTPFWERLEPHEEGANYKGPGDSIPPDHGGRPPPGLGPSGPGGGPTP